MYGGVSRDAPALLVAEGVHQDLGGALAREKQQPVNSQATGSQQTFRFQLRQTQNSIF